MLEQKRVWSFFYGSFMNRAVCATANAELTDARVARLDGWRLLIAPLATMFPAAGGTAWGVLARMSHEELARLYGMGWVGRYVPEAVIVDAGGLSCVALTYVKYDFTASQAAPDYVDRVLQGAREHGLPEHYLPTIERFKRGWTDEG